MMIYVLLLGSIFAAAAAERKCLIPCPKILQPVCGSDGVVYDNECLMRVAACKKGEAIVRVSYGKCPNDCAVACPFIYRPVCGSDGQKYPNDCAMRGSACKHKYAIVTVKEDAFDDNCGDTYSICSPICTREYNPQCGSDGKTYSNPCQLRYAACSEGKAIIAVYPGTCEA